MNYEPKFIENITIDEINAEIQSMAYERYAYGRAIDRPRMWDLEHTRKILEEGKEC